MTSVFPHIIGHISTNLARNKRFANIYFTPETPSDFIQLFTEELLGTSSRVSKKPDMRTKYDLVVHYNLSGNQRNLTKELSNLSKLVKDGGQLVVVTNNPRSQDVALNYDSQLRQLGLQPLFLEPIGKNSKIIGNKIKRTPLLSSFALNSYRYSPAIILIYRRQQEYIKYINETNLSRRLHRIKRRGEIYLDSHAVGIPVAKVRHFTASVIEKGKRLLGAYDKQYESLILPQIVLKPNIANKTRVLIVMTWMEVGGVERVMLNILKGLDKKKFDIHILTTVPSNHPWQSVFLDEGATVTHVASLLGGSWPSSYMSRYIADYIHAGKFDSILITNSHEAYYAIPQIRKLTPNCHIYDLLHTHGTPRDNDAFLKISVPYDKQIDKRIVINNYLKNYYASRYPIKPEHIEVIYNGMNPETIAAINSLNPVSKSIRDSSIHIAYIGRLDTDKSPMRLVEIASIISKKRPEVIIDVYGDGPLMKAMREKSKRLGVLDKSLYLHGYTDSPLGIMLKSHYTLLTSDSEGIPMSVLESMSCGTPGIMPAVGGIPEIISDEVDGFLAAILSSDEDGRRVSILAETIERAVTISDQDYQRMQSMAKQKIFDKFSSMGDYYSDLLSKVASRSISIRDQSPEVRSISQNQD